MKILHIHQDFPDNRAYPSTKAVSNLIDAVEHKDIKNVVLSINRTSNPLKVSFREFEYGYTLVFWALPLPYLYRFCIFLWSFVVRRKIKLHDFDLLHSHKLTSEGLFMHALNKKSKKPYFVSIRGGSDVRNIVRLPDCREIFRQLYKNAENIFWVSPWAQRIVSSHLNVPSKGISFPNICKFDSSYDNTLVQKSRYITIVSFHQYKRKGLIQLLSAISELKKRFDKTINLTIVGSGTEKYTNIIKEKIKNLNLEDCVELTGELKQSDVLKQLRISKGLLLPSKNETFGMAYIEALANGCPIMYLADTGIDGYFDKLNVGVRVSNQSIEDILQGILKIEKDYEILNKNISDLLKDDFLKGFTEKEISNLYLGFVQNI